MAEGNTEVQSCTASCSCSHQGGFHPANSHRPKGDLETFQFPTVRGTVPRGNCRVESHALGTTQANLLLFA